MKKTTPLLLLFLLASSLLTAQISPNVIKKFPAHIIYKLNEVTSKVSISEEKQTKIAALLIQKDSLAKNSLAKGEPVDQIKKHYILKKKEIINVLSPEESETYFLALEPDNRFLIALNLKNNLGLDGNQIKKIRKQNTMIDSLKFNDNQKRYQFYKHNLDSVLTRKQYNRMLEHVYKNEATIQSRKDWKNILAYNLANPKDSTMVLKKIYQYQLAQKMQLDKKREKTNSKKTALLKKKLSIEHRPDILNHYSIMSQKDTKKNLFAEAIQLKKEIKLTDVQIDSLLVNYKRLELLKLKDDKNVKSKSDKSDYKHFENKAISRLLDPKQLNELLYKKNLVKSRQLAGADWQFLEKQNLIKDLDKLKTLSEFASFHINSLVADERIKLNKNQLNLFYKRDVLLKKPELLQKIDAIKKTESNTKSAKNNLKW
jgi:hypothetical protein